MKDRIDLESRARELFPASPHLQANWVRAIPKVRATQDGWRNDLLRPMSKPKPESKPLMLDEMTSNLIGQRDAVIYAMKQNKNG